MRNRNVVAADAVAIPEWYNGQAPRPRLKSGRIASSATRVASGPAWGFRLMALTNYMGRARVSAARSARLRLRGPCEAWLRFAASPDVWKIGTTAAATSFPVASELRLNGDVSFGRIVQGSRGCRRLGPLTGSRFLYARMLLSGSQSAERRRLECQRRGGSRSKKAGEVQ